MRQSVLRKVEHGIRSGILAVFAIGVRRRDPGAVVNAVLGLIATDIPRIAERRYDIEFRPWQRVYVETAMLTHAIGMLGPYDDIWWWDDLTHTHSSTILGGFVYAVARRRDRDPSSRVVAVTVCAGLLWELAEYAIHTTANRFGFEPILVSYGKTDTLQDLVFNLFGALLVLTFGERLLGDLAEPSKD
jgi:hypothetical protein